jgi:hypothetical protein
MHQNIDIGHNLRRFAEKSKRAQTTDKKLSNLHPEI